MHLTHNSNVFKYLVVAILPPRNRWVLSVR